MSNSPKRTSRNRLKPISLWPLSLKRAFKLFMQVDPEKVKTTEREEKERWRKEKGALSSG